MTLSDALVLGRVSNLPTVWTNMLAAVILAGFSIVSSTTLPLLAALTLFYIGGMYLNDAYDAELDQQTRSQRPIPAGRTSQGEVFTIGFAMLFVALVLLLAIGNNGQPFVAGAMLAALIVLYNVWHKDNPFSPVIMGLCRVMVYVVAALCFTSGVPGAVSMGALMLLCYLIGLTYVAKQEDLNQIGQLWPLAFLAVPVIYGIGRAAQHGWAWLYLIIFAAWILYALQFVKRRAAGDIPRAVGHLIAGICLLDALLIAGHGFPGWALLAVLGFVVTLLAQRLVPGT